VTSHFVLPAGAFYHISLGSNVYHQNTITKTTFSLIIMAEVAAGLVVAEEVISNTAYAGAAAYQVAKPTMPLHATFSQVASPKDEDLR
jgi:hypothetical protein